jgi:microcystin synthetase protein McyA
MSDLLQRIAALSPEKRLLLELRKSRPESAAGVAVDEAPAARSRPFDLVPEADRARLPEGIEDAFPLSMVQSGMLSHMEPGVEVPPAYHNVNSFHLRAAFQPLLFQAAVQEVVMRHPMLRTSFDLTSYGEPLQLIHRHADLRVEVEDLRELAADERERTLESFIRRENQALLDLTRPPLLRFHVHRLTDETFQFTLTEPHSISDGWSTTSTLTEIFLRYLAKIRGQPLPIEPPPAVAFRDFVRLERQALASADTRAFWDRMLRDRTVTRLSRWPAPLRQAGGRQEHKLYFPLEPELISGLRQLATTAGVTLKSVILAAHHKVMSLMSGERDLLTGLVFNGRPEESGGTDVRGLFLNTLPFRLRVGDGSWVDLARAAFEAEVEILPHRRYPLGALQKQWGRDALFEIAFGYLNFHSVQPLLDGGDFEILPQGNSDLSITHFPLMVIFEVVPVSTPRARVILEYDLKEFCEPQMRELFEIYHEVLAAMVAAPRESHADRCFQTARQRLQVEGWNRSDAGYPREHGVHQLFEEAAGRSPDAVALAAGERRMTFAELDRAANRVAHLLRSLGVAPDVRVGLCLERGVDLVIGLLGILKAGGGYVPLDPTLPRERLAFILRDAGTTVLVTREGLAAGLAAPGLRTVRLDADAPLIAGRSGESPAVSLDPGNLAYVMYTSGSTGVPKGVMIPHRGLVNYLSWCMAEYRVGEGSGAPVHSSIGFDLTVTGLFAPLLAGRTVTLLPEDPGGEPLARALTAGEGYSLVKLTPAHLDLLSHHLRPGETSVHALVIGGEALTGEALAPWIRTARDTRLVNEYGPTETVVGCTAYTVPAGIEISGPVPIGRPIANARIALLDERLIPVPVGAPGELFVGGDVLARGYQGRPDLTAAAFLPDPLGAAPGARLYRTGDLGRYLPDGNLEYLGRVDHQVKVKGYRIELGEIEAVLAQCPGVRSAVVVAREDAPGEKRLVAYVVGESAVEECRDTLAARLPDYMIPAVFVVLGSLPLTANGKVDRRALPAPPRAAAEEEAYVAPRTPAEEILAGIWAQALGLERVGVHDNFFSLGGDSITGLLSISKAKKAGLNLTSRQIFQHPTIAELALVAAAGAAAAPALATAATTAAPLTPIQSWFFAQEVPDPHHFNQALLLEIRRPLRPEILERVATLLRERHPALRTRFVREPDGWRPLAGEAAGPSPFLRIDLSALPAARRRAALEGGAAELQLSLSLVLGVLWRTAFYDLGPESHGRLLLVAHHLAVDGVSWRILLNDLQTAYQQLAEGEPVALPAATTPFDEWAQRLRAFACSAELKAELPFWSRRHSVPPLPRDFDGRNTVGSQRMLFVPFGEERTAQLQKAAQRHGAPLQELLLAALALTLARWTGETRFLIDLEGHGREDLFSDLDLSRTVGWFTSLFPVALDLGAAADPATAVREVGRQLRAVPGRGIGFGLLRYLAAEETARPLRDLPSAEVSFNYLGQFDHALARPEELVLARELAGPLRSPEGLRSHGLEFGAQIVGGDLRMDWIYSAALHRRATIEGLAASYTAFLADLLAGPEAVPVAPAVDRELALALEEAEFEGEEA